MSESGHVPPPEVLAVGICDAIHRDPATGKRYILGCFSMLQVPSFPCQHPSLAVYLDLVNGRGSVNVQVQLVDLDGERDPVWKGDMKCDFPNPRVVAELDFIVGGLVFPAPGEYRVQVFANGEYLVERRLVVHGIAQQSA